LFKFVNSGAARLAPLVVAISFLSIEVGAIELGPQEVATLASKQSIQIRGTELQAQAAEGNAEKQRGIYDLILKIAPTYEYTEALTLTGAGNPSDKTITVLSSIAKRFSTGTTMVLEYQRINQESTLSTFTQSLRRPNAALDAVTFSVRQALWSNILGEADRALLGSLDGLVQLARLQREESLELTILDSLSAFWNAYVAETQLRETTAAREKYQELVKAVRRKAGYNLSTPGELPRLEAEFEATDKSVKLNAAIFLNKVDTLRTVLQIDRKEPIIFRARTTEVADIPDIPVLQALDAMTLRPMLISKLKMENAERTQTSVRSNNRPRFDLVAKARSTGVDETNDVSFSKMTSNSKPTYSVGVEIEWPLDSAAFRGARAEAEAGYQLSQLQFKLDQDFFVNDMFNAERSAIALRDNALSSIQIVMQRSKVVKEMESAYRQGRTPLVELIRAFNDLFTAQQSRARAVGDYMIALNQWAAVRDELVKNTLPSAGAKRSN
jgi:outer membrane protein TolC